MTPPAPVTITAAARERKIFLAALDAPPGERRQFVEGACGDAPDMRDRLLAMLAEQDDLGTFLEAPAVTRPGSHRLEQSGDQVGHYRLLEKIGEGGCGVVYMAEQEHPVRRRVALKVLKPGMDTRSVIARFEAERQALAMMDHPHIARVFDAGTTDTGRPYFAMELVRGVRITDFCDEQRLPTADRLQLLVLVCHAIQHAHQKGIIHRDIKPSNVLVTLHDGVPVPKIIDFGIAKATEQRLTDKTLFTHFTSFLGTPAYMSPEQAELSGIDIDTRSDIYSLGVLLYELLTGGTPFDATRLLEAGLDECRRTIREDEPRRPSVRLAALGSPDLAGTAQQRRTDPARLIHLLRGDLDWVAMKCLEKDRARRYATANDLASDLARYLDNEPVIARPPSNIYRLQKLLRRHRGAVAATAAVAATLVIGATLSAWLAIRATTAEHRARAASRQETTLRREAETQRIRAEQEKSLARLNEYVADINLAQQSWAAGNLGRARQLLAKHQPQAGEPDRRGFEWRYLWQLCQGDPHTTLPVSSNGVLALAVSSDGRHLALGHRESVDIWDLGTRAPVVTLARGGHGAAFMPGTRSLVTAGFGSLRIWSIDTWTERENLLNFAAPLALSASGRRLAAVGREGVRVWQTSDWRELQTIPGVGGPVALSRDGTRLVAESRSGLAVWTIGQEQPQCVLEDSTNLFIRRGPFPDPSADVIFSPDGRTIVAPRNTLTARGVFVLSLWNAQTGRELATMPDDPDHPEHTGAIAALAFSPDGRRLATGSHDHSVRLWDWASRSLVATFQGHAHEVWALAFSPDGQTLISAARDGAVKLWPTRPQPKDDVIPGTWQPLAFSRNSRTLAASNRRDTVAFIDVANREIIREFRFDHPVSRGGFRPPQFLVAVSDDLRWLAHAREDGSVRLWNVATDDSTTLAIPDQRVDLLAFSPDGRRLVTGGGRWRELRIWDVASATNFAINTETFRVAVSPDGNLLAAFPRSGPAELWDLSLRSRRLVIGENAPGALLAAFSPDQKILATIHLDDAIRLWDTTDGRALGICTGHKQAVWSVTFSPDGRTLATASDDSTLKLWCVATQQELLTMRRLGGSLRGLTFSPDGRYLVGGASTSSRTDGLQIYRSPTFQETDPVPDAEPAGRR